MAQSVRSARLGDKKIRGSGCVTFSPAIPLPLANRRAWAKELLEKYPTTEKVAAIGLFRRRVHSR
ncbi:MULTISPECIES: hypothetical protein [Micrococcales]|uniref:Uncharacterized protein n=1 Tax=Metallococcus carri TaxID=1656884 RepID=A0A967AXR4_9MICO|nr:MULTISPECIES: hypothetical protein [Micrococcales]NOP36792.1 hypothetical protein [Calidifontibacter sp. DB2511S]MCT1549034.1 hypothetical protein [Brevibacterium casei]MCT1558899.1 hypothetical protein [Brevibacterium casei]MCT2207244.1 hypothetical protein [Brevibacterium casei]NHN54369.1 hypothetical protein [Metallococcus carri]